MDAFLSAIFGAQEVKASARVKLATGEVRTVNLHTVPVDASESAFAEAAKGGVDLSVRVKTDDDRSRNINGRGVFGAAAVSATCSVLGFTPTAEAEKAKVRKGKDKDATTEPKGKDGPTEPTIG